MIAWKGKITSNNVCLLEAFDTVYSVTMTVNELHNKNISMQGLKLHDRRSQTHVTESVNMLGEARHMDEMLVQDSWH